MVSNGNCTWDIPCARGYPLALSAEHSAQPALFFCFYFVLISLIFAGGKLLLYRSGVKCLGGLRRLLGRHQCRADFRQPCVQSLDLLVLYRKLPLQRIDCGLQYCYHTRIFRLLQYCSIGALRMRIRMRSNGALLLQKVLFYKGFALLLYIQNPLLRMRIRSANRIQLAFVPLINRLLRYAYLVGYLLYRFCHAITTLSAGSHFKTNRCEIPSLSISKLRSAEKPYRPATNPARCGILSCPYNFWSS